MSNISENGLYIQLFSIHGLVRGVSPELGIDADTGGQVQYVLELAKNLAKKPQVRRVDLFTRLIQDKRVFSEYSQQIEELAPKARIVRIQCGGKKYIRKELLWPHLDEFVDRTIQFVKANNLVPDFCHGHYADGGYVAKDVAEIFDVPFIFTGHSMGRHKKNKLLQDNVSLQKLNKYYNIDYRIQVEEDIIKAADQVIVSSNHELREQYGLYQNQHISRYKIIPPGVDLSVFHPYYDRFHNPDGLNEPTKQVRMAIMNELRRFWMKPEKPFILALCRPDQRKNITGLIQAYGKDHELQKLANLAIFAGIRKDISKMAENEQNVLTEMLLDMDRYDLYGKMAIPKRHDFALEVPKLYRLCAEAKGVFVNPALIEPFGFTLIEASACGLPIVATKHGGPVDIIKNCGNGCLIEPTNHQEIAAALKKLLLNDKLWSTYSNNGINGVHDHYSWNSHASSMVAILKSIHHEFVKRETAAVKVHSAGRRLTSLNKFLITDIDNTLIGDGTALAELIAIFRKHRHLMGWGVASGRSLELVLDILKEYNVPTPDIIISSVGTEIYYGPDLYPDKGWASTLTRDWKPDKIRAALAPLEFLQPQQNDAVRNFKLSYLMAEKPDFITEVHRVLHAAKLRYNLIYSHHQYLDILPFRASKGKAIRYIGTKWGIPTNQIVTCGDSGNDEDMLRGPHLGVVVGNFSNELANLRNSRNVYFSNYAYGGGIIDGLNHYNLLEKSLTVATDKIPEQDPQRI